MYRIIKNSIAVNTTATIFFRVLFLIFIISLFIGIGMMIVDIKNEIYENGFKVFIEKIK